MDEKTLKAMKQRELLASALDHYIPEREIAGQPRKKDKPVTGQSMRPSDEVTAALSRSTVTESDEHVQDRRAEMLLHASLLVNSERDYWRARKASDG